MNIFINSPTSPDAIIDKDSLFSLEEIREHDMLADELSIDTMSAQVTTDSLATVLRSSDNYAFEGSDDAIYTTIDTYDITTLPKGTPLYLDGDKGKYYLESLRRTGKYTLSLEAYSGLRILSKQIHNGGLYTGQAFSTVVADILGPSYTGYTVSTEAAQTTVYGWLPIATRRENLHQLLFATGICIHHNLDGSVVFQYDSDGADIHVLPASATYIGGTVNYLTAANEVQVTEHRYIQASTDQQKTLYDNLTGEYATAARVEFSNPCYAVRWLDTTGAEQTITELGVNYAVVSGYGTLVGKEYTHITRVVNRKTGSSSVEDADVSRVIDATLVSPLNSDAVADRLLSYKSTAISVETSFLRDGNNMVSAGDLVQYTTPFGDTQQGYISQLDISYTSIAKAKAKILAGYMPKGGGGAFANVVELRYGKTSWTKPAGITRLKLVIIGGGSGGNVGSFGQNSSYGEMSSDGKKYFGGGGGAGGAGGSAGLGGKIKMVTIDVPEAQATYSISAARGGSGADYDFADITWGEDKDYPTCPITAAAEGNAQTITINGTTYSSAEGSRSVYGYTDILTQKVYGLPGYAGISGGKGGNGEGYKNGPSPEEGEGVTDLDEAYWSGGKMSERLTPYDDDRFESRIYPAGGGGAAAGMDGYDAELNERHQYRDDIYASYGGAGADATSSMLYTCRFGGGGAGGNGGGGAGGCGGMRVLTSSDWTRTWTFHVYYAYGGKGSVGDEGARGGVLIYY